MGVLSTARMVANKDFLALVVCNVIGYFIGSFLPHGAWSVYTSALVSYHLFLAWLLFTAEQEARFSLPFLPTVVTHSSFLVVVIGLPILRHFIPFFFLLRFGITFLAKFEVTWLFTAATPRANDESDPVVRIGTSRPGRIPRPAVAASVSPDLDPFVIPNDHEAWTHYLANRKLSDLKRGLSIKDEYAQWMKARNEARAKALPAVETASRVDPSPANTQTA